MLKMRYARHAAMIREALARVEVALRAEGADTRRYMRRYKDEDAHVTRAMLCYAGALRERVAGVVTRRVYHTHVVVVRDMLLRRGVIVDAIMSRARIRMLCVICRRALRCAQRCYGAIMRVTVRRRR